MLITEGRALKWGGGLILYPGGFVSRCFLCLQLDRLITEGMAY